MILKEINEYPGYKISECGVVYSKRTGKTMKFRVVNDGVLKASLINSAGKAKEVALHRLVALAHIPNPANKPQVDHIDGNKHNNHRNNLRWCTNEENQKFRDIQGNSGSGCVGKKIKWGDSTYNSIRELAKIIAEKRGSKPETVRKELKTVRYKSKKLYGKFCELVV